MRVSFPAMGLLVGFLLSGCDVPELTASELKQMDLVDLCQAYSTSKEIGWANRVAQTRAELVARSALTKRDVTDIDEQVIRTGQKEHVMVCSWGPYKSRNETAGNFGRYVQYVFDDFGPYGYTQNGRVTSWQTKF